MRLRHQRAPALLLLLPALHAFAASIATDLDNKQVARAAPPEYADATALPSPTPIGKVGTKDAPVDGLDGKPHRGPYVDDKPPGPKKQPAGVEELRPGATRISSPTIQKTKEELAALGVDGDGVMDDPNRPSPQGNTGIEGGVSAKEKDRKEKEDKTGEKTEKVPESPKELPPLPHGQETPKDKEGKDSQTKALGAQGLEVIRHSHSTCMLSSNRTVETHRSSRITPRHPPSPPSIAVQR